VYHGPTVWSSFNTTVSDALPEVNGTVGGGAVYGKGGQYDSETDPGTRNEGLFLGHRGAEASPDNIRGEGDGYRERMDVSG